MNSIIIKDFLNKNPDFSLFIGIPAYGGNLKSGFVQSLMKLQAIFLRLGIPHDYLYLSGESLICRGRNAIVSKFLATPHSHLLFLDTDLIFNPASIVNMIINDFQIVGLSYPKKGINWNKAKHMIENNNFDKNSLSDMNFNPLLDEDGNCKTLQRFMCAKDIPTGGMLINRNVFYTLMRKYPELRYQNNISRYDDQLCYDFFRVGVCPESNFYLSEDYYFCKLLRDSGYELWIDYKSALGHIGEYEYWGSIDNELQSGLIQYNKDLVKINGNR